MKLLDAFIMGYGSQVTIHVYWPLVCKNFINSFFSQLKLVIMDIFNSRRIIFIGRHHNNASQKKLKLKLIVNVSLITYIKKNAIALSPTFRVQPCHSARLPRQIQHFSPLCPFRSINKLISV